MYSEIKMVRVCGMSAAVSSNWQSLLDVSDEDPEIIQKFIKKTKVEGRYAANRKQTTSDFCFAAANKLLDDKQIDRDDVGVLVFVTQTPDYDLPATACVLQHRLGIGKECICFDVNLGCSGFTYGMNIISSLVQTSKANYGLLLVGDTVAKEKSSKRKEKVTHASSMLFGDSGTAILVKKDDNPSTPPPNWLF